MKELNQRNILFVDDDEFILSGFRRSFYNRKNDWNIEYVDSGEKALSSLESTKYNVIVSDMRMPQMNGAELLKKVKDSYPDTIRIILSGQTELEMVMRTVHVAHQFLSKPCEVKHLEEVINRVCSLQDVLNNQYIKNIVGRIGKLPTLPKTYQDLCKALCSTRVSIGDITSIVEKDIAVCAKVLQLANSAFFSLPRRITDISQAINNIGITTLKSLALSVGTFDAFKKEKSCPLFLIEQLQEQSLLCANIAKSMLEDKNQADDAFLAGLLHSIGKLILMVYLPNEYQNALNLAKMNKKKMYIIEKEIFGVSYPEIGAYLLGIWGIPYTVVEAVAYQLDPVKVEHNEFDVVDAVYVATLILNNEHEGIIDTKYLQSLGIEHHLPKWQAMIHSTIQSDIKGI